MCCLQRQIRARVSTREAPEASRVPEEVGRGRQDKDKEEKAREWPVKINFLHFNVAVPCDFTILYKAIQIRIRMLSGFF